MSKPHAAKVLTAIPGLVRPVQATGGKKGNTASRQLPTSVKPPKGKPRSRRPGSGMKG